jgi:hypothetical protein
VEELVEVCGDRHRYTLARALCGWAKLAISVAEGTTTAQSHAVLPWKYRPKLGFSLLVSCLVLGPALL